MQRLELKKVEHAVKIGHVCGMIEPNVREDTLLVEDGEVVGFYLRNIAEYSMQAAQLAACADAELRSPRVPKSTMKRSSGLKDAANEVLQYSTILGGVPPKPHMKRAYMTMSSVHAVESAALFIKAMVKLCHEAEDIVGKVAPMLRLRQQDVIARTVPEKWRFGTMFTSSISNYNIAAPFHRDGGNIIGCNNIIIAKRWASEGGNTTVPDYGVTFDSCDNSMVFYPAWKNVHGVTPIVPREKGGYRNTLIFYPLKAFCVEASNE